MRVAPFTWVKSWVSIAELLQVQRLARTASESKSILTRLSYTYKIIKILTERRFFFISIFYYAEILAMFNFNASTDAEEMDFKTAEEKILSVACDIGSRSNKLPREVLAGMSFNEVEKFMKSLILRKLEDIMSMLSAYHSPEKTSKQTTRRMREINRDLRSTSKQGQLAEPVRIKDMFAGFA